MKSASSPHHQNQLRIIGGSWRSRKFYFPPIAAIRPTPNRVRETLFNWLAPMINHAHCLDLFAGSGSLGFEALSRGASSVTFIDNQYEAIEHLQKTNTIFAAHNAKVINLEIPNRGFIPEKKFDIVFLDPPFNQQLIGPCCEWLIHHSLLANTAYIYIEVEKTLTPLPIPNDWQLIKTKVAGQVKYCLFQEIKK